MQRPLLWNWGHADAVKGQLLMEVLRTYTKFIFVWIPLNVELSSFQQLN
jgi:hypothetical protein